MRRDSVASKYRSEGPVSTRGGRSFALPRRSVVGHEDAFPAVRLNGRCPFSQPTFAGASGNGKDAPFAAIRRILSIAARFGLSLLPPAAGPGLATCHRVFLRRSPARRGSGELKIDRHADPALPVDLRAGNVRNDQG
jgi:hypothetical protein